MFIKSIATRLIAVSLCVALLIPSATAQQSNNTQTPDQKPTGLTLEALEQLALKNNPTLSQAEAAIQAAEGRRRQAGLWPNPTV
ncbi:MAG: hypothetical protein ACRD82_12530, partial [Blastocatellia bacterium]